MNIILISFVLCGASFAAKYPNEITDQPLVLCEPERILIKVRTTSSNPSHIYADDFPDDPDCSSRNMNKIALRHGKCGMSTERTDNPSGIIQRVCISVQLHPLFVTESDRSYCAQCVYVHSQVLDDFESTLDISDAVPTELAPQFDVEKMPKCSYTIRKGSESGPEVRYAAVGESVYHVWQCAGENAGILVQNCFVEDGQGNRILVIDQNGCGVDQYVMPTPEYSADLTTAFQETHVFKFAHKTVTRFICQIRICMRSEECQNLTVSITHSIITYNIHSHESFMEIALHFWKHASNKKKGLKKGILKPPTTCPSLQQRLQQAKTQREAPGDGVKKIMTFEEPDASPEDEAVERLPQETRPPASKPENDFKQNATLGSIYYGYGYDAVRNRRELAEPRVSVSKGYPEVDLVGELRVLDSPDDVMYFERSSGKPNGCASPLTYSLLIAGLVIVSILLAILIVILIAKSSSSRNKVVRFGN